MTTLLSWEERPQLTASILNPALVGAVVAWSAYRFEEKSGDGMPWEVSFLIPPLIFHRETRQKLPNTIRSHLSAWVGDHPSTLATFPDRTRRFQPHVREGLRWALRTKLLVLDDTRLAARLPKKLVLPPDTELTEMLTSAATLGAILGRAGTSANIYTILGVTP